MRSTRSYRTWKALPNKGVHTQRKIHVALRLMLLGLPIVLIIILAFFLFYTRLYSLLDAEKQTQYESRARQCANLITYQITSDQNRLASLAHSLSNLTIHQSLEIVEGLDNAALTLITENIPSEVMPFAVDALSVVHRFAFLSSDGNQALLQLKLDPILYQAILECPEHAKASRMIWANERGEIIWQSKSEEQLFEDKTLATLFPAWSQGMTQSLLMKTDSSFVAIIPLGDGNGYFVLESHDRLLEMAYLTILQASLSMAVLVSLLLLSLLFYLLYKDYVYEQSLMHLAFEDELTGLPNKNHFVQEAAQLLGRARSPYAVIILDIGKFKLINDHFGYAFGDSMLLHFSKVLPRYTTKDGVCARLSGDKFILLCSYREKETLERRISVITEELKRFSFPGSSPFQLDILIGISLIEGNAVPINAAIDRALFALSALKERQTSGSLYYDEVLRSELLEESELEKVFAKAIKDGEFYVVLQPKYSLQTRRLVGCEALVRWDHPGKGRLAPSQFIPLLEKHNLLVTLDMFVLEQVCTLIKGWQNKGLPIFPISVNQSRSYLFNTHYERTLVDLIDRYGVSHQLIEFELTESLFLNDVKHLSLVLASLRSHSFLVSIDDFGSGYSSLTMLKDVGIDVIKLDQGFLKGTDEHHRGKVVVQHVIAMAKQLGITTVAEGVETSEQAQMLQLLGCDVVQGYFFSHPLEISEYEALLIDDRLPSS